MDRSFMYGVEQMLEDAEITKGITSLAHALNLRVITEGVENRLQLEELRKMGCDTAQGYYFSRPLPDEVASKLLGTLSAF
jgi:EAL domain-containing protein (putative c-di-GMP-specific phosphodiesterase class I)